MGLELNIDVRREPGRAIVTGEVLRDGAPVAISWPVIVVNPPEFVVRDGVKVHDPDGAIRETILGLVG